MDLERTFLLENKSRFGQATNHSMLHIIYSNVAWGVAMNRCIFCGRADELVTYKNKFVCIRCIVKLIMIGYPKLEDKNSKKD